MAKRKNNLYADIIEGLEAAVDYAQGKKRKGTKATKLSISPVQKRTAHQIRALRNRLNLTQVMFAQVLGVTKKAVEAWEAGTKSPSGPALRMFEILDKASPIFEKMGIYSQGRESA